MTKRHELTTKQYELIKDLLPGRKGTVGPVMDNHKFLNGVFCYLKTGCPWRDLPPHYGKWKSIHRRFSRWCQVGIFQKIFERLLQEYKEDFDFVQLDSSIVRVHQHASGAKKKII